MWVLAFRKTIQIIQKMNIRQKIIKMLGETIDAEIEDCLEYELDSLTFMQFIVSLEEEFDLEIPDSLLFYDGKETFENIICYLQEWCKKNEN